jgi:hypothetical protein
MCTQRSDVKVTYRWIQKPHVQVRISNKIPTQSWRFRLSRNHPEIHRCCWKSTADSSLIKQYGTRRSKNTLVVGGAAMYKRWMMVRNQTEPQLQGITVSEVLGGSSMAGTYQAKIPGGY